MLFEELSLHDALLDALYDMHFDTCTPIQEKCIPPILDGRDVIGIAQTGTGKTAAYLLPLLTLLKNKPHPSDAVNCLVMAPTRELARQIDQALQGFGYYIDINGVAVYGGNDGIRYEQEKRSFANGADIVIATPGRLISHLSLGSLDLSRTTHLVLDEADRMLDMGFYDDIMQIVKTMPKERQTILFSATMPDKIAEIARETMHDPVEVRIAVAKPAEGIRQGVFVCREMDKTPILKYILLPQQEQTEQQPSSQQSQAPYDAASLPSLTISPGTALGPTIIFASSKQKVKELHLLLRKWRINAAAMHSDLEQKDRDETMLAFKARKIQVLVATDIVARGIDIDDIALVVNYDAPRDAEDYVHRIGRTARAGKHGRAITLIGERDRMRLRSIEQLLEKKIPREPLPEGIAAPQERIPRDGNRKPENGGKDGTGRGRNNHRRGGRQKGGRNNGNGKPSNMPRESRSRRPPKE